MNMKKAMGLAAIATALAGDIVIVDDQPRLRSGMPRRAKKFKKHLSEYATPPVSMSEGTKYLYSKKPNIQYWQNLHGENVIDKSVSELQAMGL